MTKSYDDLFFQIPNILKRDQFDLELSLQIISLEWPNQNATLMYSHLSRLHRPFVGVKFSLAYILIL